MRTSIVLGLSYGDEGKGLTTSFLASQSSNPIVVRFNGGHQAGHTVVMEDKRHVFSHFGSGTLQGVPTYWSRYCTFYPTGFKKEWEALNTNGAPPPQMFVHPLCPVTTPYEVMANQNWDKFRKNGTVGVGFGQTIERHEKSPYRLYVQDLFYPHIWKEKLKRISDFYPGMWQDVNSVQKKELDYRMEIFISAIELIIATESITTKNPFYRSQWDHVIFEGAQGIMLDMDFGFFPHVTRSNTTSKNAIQIIHENGLQTPQIYYITRSYQTRHGEGPMSNENKPVPLTNNEYETNIYNNYQGRFRTGILDIDELSYALECDSHFHDSYPMGIYGIKKNLVVTCLDQTGETFQATHKGLTCLTNVIDLKEKLGLHHVYGSNSPDSGNVSKIVAIING